MNLYSKTAISLITFWIVSDAAVAETQTGGATIAMQPGQCRVLLNGANLGCPTGAVYSRLENGRHLVNFPTAEIATIGFAGKRLEVTGSASSVLWLDGVYINQQRSDADGQCTFERKAQGSVELSCTALLRDGRKLSSSLANQSQKDSFLGVELETVAREKCEMTLKMHGMLSRAQFQCGFRKYNTALIDKATSCAPAVGEENLKRLLRQGMSLFDQQEKERGRKVVCRSILADFPAYVRK
jgi:hypothetical protein